MADALGHARCDHCGAEYRLFTIFNRDMQALCNGWKRRHERGCKTRTPAQRRKWAKPYIGKDRIDSSIVVDMGHPGFQEMAGDKSLALSENIDFGMWFDNLCGLVLEKTGIDFQDKDSVQDDFDAGKHFADVADDIAAEYGGT